MADNTIVIKELEVHELNNKAIKIGQMLDGLSVSQSNYIINRIQQDMNSNSFIKYTKVLGCELHLRQSTKED